jgi:hypothetical protein
VLKKGLGLRMMGLPTKALHQQGGEDFFYMRCLVLIYRNNTCYQHTDASVMVRSGSRARPQRLPFFYWEQSAFPLAVQP